MKTMMLVALLLGSIMPLHAQQLWCFSANCPQTRAILFAPNRRNEDLGKIFRPPLVLPGYKPVAPLAFSPASRQFFLYSPQATKMDYPLALPTATGSTHGVGSRLGNTTNAFGVAGGKGLPMLGPHFSSPRR